jgi:hypothetical protein
MIEHVGVVIYDDGQVGGTVDRTVKAIEALGGTLVEQHRSSASSPETHATFALPDSAVIPVARLDGVMWLEYQLAEWILE